MHEETYSHLFVQCNKVKDLWIYTERWVNKEYCKDAITFGTDQVIVNQLSETPGHLFNFICLLLKQFIYMKRCKQEKLHFIEFQSHIKNIQNIEKYIAIKNNNL